MKKYLRYALLFAAIGAGAQDFRGIAVYESKTSLDLGGTNASGDEITIDLGPGMKEQLAKAMEKSYTMHFDKSASLYEENQELDAPTGGNMLQVKFAGGGKQYKDLKTRTSIVESDIFDKEFLIVDSLKSREWKLSDETKKIGDYTCYKATFVQKPKPLPENEPGKADKKVNIMSLAEKERVITAWYAPAIPVSHGPGEYWGLPGLILEVNDGRTSLLCSKIVLNPKEKFGLKVPNKGEKVTQAEFDAIMEEKLNEMDQMDGTTTTHGNGGTTTRVFRIGG